MERYAKRIHFYGSVALPRIFIDAVQGSQGTYVDLGCGDGSKLRITRDVGILDRFEDVLAIDLSSERLARVLSLNPTVSILAKDACATGLGDHSVDFLFSDQVIEHVRDDVSMAKEVARVLKPEGKAFIGSVVKGKGAWYFYRCKGQWRMDPTHVREYKSLEDFTECLAAGGLQVLASALSPVSYPVTDIFLRLLLLTRLLKADDALNIYARNAWLRRLSGFKVPIFRYYYCYAILKSKRATQSLLDADAGPGSAG